MRLLYFVLLPLWLGLSGCVATAQAPSPVAEAGAVHTQTLQEGTISVAILSDTQARDRLGVDLARKSLQAVWMKVENRTDETMWFIVTALDLDYYSADEVAQMFRSGKQDVEVVRQQLRNQSMRLRLPAGSTTEGHVFVPRAVGGRFINVVLNLRDRNVEAGFAVPLPDGDFDYEKLLHATHYGDAPVPDLDLAQLRGALEKLPCCAMDESASRTGDPLNLVLAGPAYEILTALHRSGWTFTHRITVKSVRREISAAIAGTEYPTAPVSPLYLFGRAQDIALQRGRRSLSERNHMRLWLAPFTFEKQPVWICQASRDIGIKLTPRSPILMTHVIDPQVDEAREFVLQSLLGRGLVKRFGFIEGVGEAPLGAPRANLTNDHYFTDGLRLFLQPSPHTLAPQDIDKLDWEEVSGPIAFGQSTPASAQ